MEFIVAIAGGLTLLFLNNKKENFEETYFDSEQYYKQNVSPNEAKLVNQYSPSVLTENKELKLVRGDNNTTYSPYDNGMSGYELNNKPLTNQTEWVKENSLYLNDKINGIPLKDYYEKYTKETLANGNWFLNKDMPQETKQYLNDSEIQRKMELQTGLLQKRDREMLGVPNKKEIVNMFTPEEKTTGYGYQYGSGGPGYSFGPIENVPETKEGEQPTYLKGKLAMARVGNDAKSMGSQFFIVYEDSVIPSDSAGGYTVFGEVTTGLSGIDDIIKAGVEDGSGDGQPKVKTSVTSITVK
jgi:cyclophilin family peptidyl-prolyl cis-trans isomerase